MLTRTFVALVVAMLASSAGCRAPDASPAPSPVVATIDRIPVPLSAFENYLAVHFVEEELDEPVPQEDTDRVLSRLFDDFVAESLLVLEADRRGVEVDDAEIAAWLGEEGDPDPAREAARRAQARRELVTRRLLDAWLRAEDRAQLDDGSPARGAEDAAERLTASLRARYTIKIQARALPFRYVPEAPAVSEAH